jgi:hypothetical protein
MPPEPTLPRIVALTLFEAGAALRAEWHDNAPLPLTLTLPGGTIALNAENAQRLLRLLLDNLPVAGESRCLPY